MAAKKNRGLGRGLDSLFSGMEISIQEPEEIEAFASGKKQDKSSDEEQKNVEIDENSIRYIDINDIKPNANQPRKDFNEEKISELADSILEHGIIQPLVLRKSGKGYEIVAGERRWRAARKAELKKIPCIIRELTDEQNMLLSIIENMQREDLNPIEEAEAIHQMVDTYGLTQEQVSKSLGKSRPYITNALRLLRLPDEVQLLVTEGQLTAGHARALVTIEDKNKLVSLAKKAAEEGLSVREMERLANEAISEEKKKPRKRSKARPPEVAAVEEELKDILGTRVNLKQRGRKGKLEIEYYSRDELERLLEMFKSLK